MSTGSSGTESPPRILVPLDGSKFSESALPVAARVARAEGAELDLARVHLPIAVLPAPGEFSLPSYQPEWDQEARQASHSYLQERVGRVERELGVRARPVLLDGNVAHALDEHVRDNSITLVVTTSHGRGGLSRVIQGSVVDELVRLVNIPVITIHPRTGSELQTAPETFERILVPLDGSDTAHAVIEPAARLAHVTGASVVLLHVLTPSAQAKADSRPAEALVGDPASDPLAAEGARMLESAAEPLRARGLDVQTVLRVATDPAECILGEAERLGADCIAIATHGRGGLTRMLFGSVADRVFRGASHAVMLLRAQPVHRQAGATGVPAADSA